MTEHELKKIISAPTPKPQAHARNAACTDALAEFDASFSETDAETAHPAQSQRRNLGTRPKDSQHRTRLSSNSTWLERKSSMRSLSKYAVAASVIAVAVVGPASIYVLQFKDSAQYASPGRGGNLGIQDLSVSHRGLDRRDPTIGAQKKRTAKVKRDENRTMTRLTVRQGLGAKPSQDMKVAKTEKITPPATGRLRQMGEFYTYNRSPQGPTDGLGAVSGGGGWTRSMGGAASNQALSPNAPSYGITSRTPHSQNLAAAGASTNFGDDTRQRIHQSRDKFEGAASNVMKQVAVDPVSTFSLDVDTASYAFVRRSLNAGRLPPKDAVRVEELVNYFHYDYQAPVSANEPFKVEVNIVPPPWNEVNRLVHLSIKGYELSQAERPPANLVFLIDVSGSMSSQDKLPLVKTALQMLVSELQPDDTIGIVTYASGTAVALEPTKAGEIHKIRSVISGLRSGGSTAGARGIQDAYRLAEKNFNPEGVNRIILATDGDFNVGITNREDLKRYIERKRKSGVFLSILGFGRGNYNDALMQTLAQNGNGTASYIDTLNEARKVLVDEASSTLFTIAKDVKVQVEFNPQRVRAYRLIGYETRALKREDFNNDRVDAGDVGSGHSITAIYEITPVGAPQTVDDLRYGNAKPEANKVVNSDAEYGFIKLRYKLPQETKSNLISRAITTDDEKARLDQVSDDTRFSIAVAGFGQLLRHNPAVREFGYGDVIALAQTSKGEDRFGYRAEFINLARNAQAAAR